jgi:predicted nuclease of predicted toxin-antitoxin system
VKIKVDENIDRNGVELLRQGDHDVMTVSDQGLTGTTDEHLFQICVAEGRTLVSLDRDFGHVTRFPPKQTAGIVILELGAPASLSLLQERIRAFLALAASRSVKGELWIIEPGRVRVRLEKDAE